MTAFDALAQALDRLAAAVRLLGQPAFTRRAFACSGSIGAHVRHVLDHVHALEAGMATGTVCYDYRERDTVVERHPHLAWSRLTRAALRARGVDDTLLPTPLTLVARIADEGRTVTTGTTVARELAFVISHTIHHSALVAVLMEEAAYEAPRHLGLAPTTPRQEDARCAR